MVNKSSIFESLEFLLFFQRGWATWTTGAVDQRVVSIVPVVLDLLNLVQVSLSLSLSLSLSHSLSLSLSLSLTNQYHTYIDLILFPFS